jgi:hypothetical protein
VVLDEAEDLAAEWAVDRDWGIEASEEDWEGVATPSELPLIRPVMATIRAAKPADLAMASSRVVAATQVTWGEST